MKFLLIANYLPHVMNFRGKLLEAISNLGYEIHIFLPDLDSYPNEYKHLNSLGYHLHSIPLQRTGTNPVIDTKTLIYTYRLLLKIKPDVILSYTIKPVIYGTFAAWLAKVPHRYILISGLGYTFQNANTDISYKPNRLQRLVYTLYKTAVSKSSKVFFQNFDDLQLFKDLKLMNQTVPAIVVNGSGVDTDYFNLTPLPKDSNNNVLPSFLLVARLLKDKGVLEYIEAAKIVKSKYPDAKFNLVGWIDENPAAISKKSLDQWIDEGIIKYWGKLDDVRPAVSACSAFVLPSYREGTSRAVLEAMSMGRPIITTDAPGCHDTVEESKNGFIVPVKSINELADRMIEMIENPRLFTTMGRESRKLAMDKYDVNKVNSFMINEMGL